jgi:hypothetical protein
VLADKETSFLKVKKKEKGQPTCLWFFCQDCCENCRFFELFEMTKTLIMGNATRRWIYVTTRKTHFDSVMVHN